MKRSGDNTDTLVGFQHPLRTVEINSPTQKQTFEQEYSDLTANNRRPLAPYSRSTSQSFSQGTRSYVFSRTTKHVADVIGIRPSFLENLLDREDLVCNATARTKPHGVSSSFGSIISPHLFAKLTAYTFQGRLNRKMPW